MTNLRIKNYEKKKTNLFVYFIMNEKLVRNDLTINIKVQNILMKGTIPLYLFDLFFLKINKAINAKIVRNKMHD